MVSKENSWTAEAAREIITENRRRIGELEQTNEDTPKAATEEQLDAVIERLDAALVRLSDRIEAAEANIRDQIQGLEYRLVDLEAKVRG